jgi:quinol monooxygenase YgiN
MEKKIIARVFVKNECVEAFKKETVGLITTTRSEVGCISYNLFEDVFVPGNFVFVEEYKNQEAVDYHLSSAHLKSFGEKAANFFSKEMKVEVI